jgi:hypothetical protein
MTILVLDRWKAAWSNKKNTGRNNLKAAIHGKDKDFSLCHHVEMALRPNQLLQ